MRISRDADENQKRDQSNRCVCVAKRAATEKKAAVMPVITKSVPRLYWNLRRVGWEVYAHLTPAITTAGNPPKTIPQIEPRTHAYPKSGPFDA